MEFNETQIRAIVSEVLDEKLKPIATDIDGIKVKLNNHVEHYAYQFTEVKNDVAWIKKLFDPKDRREFEKTEMGKNATQTADIAWLKWGVRIVLGTVVAEALAIAAHIFLQ